jgi:hypothetical protein
MRRIDLDSETLRERRRQAAGRGTAPAAQSTAPRAPRFEETQLSEHELKALSRAEEMDEQEEPERWDGLS